MSSGSVIEKLCTPGSLHTRAKAVALTRETRGLDCGGGNSGILDDTGDGSGKVREVLRELGAGFGAIGLLGDGVPVGTGSLICVLEWNSMRPSDQSINGLCCRSQLIPRTI